MSEEIVLSDRNVPRPTLQDELTKLYSRGFLTDITLSTEDGKNFEAHRVLLAARSTYFHSVVPRLKSEPVIFLKGIKGAHLDKILKFIYGSSVHVSKHQLKPILEVAKVLQVKGLQDVTPNDILSRQSVVSAGKFKPDSPLASPVFTNKASHKSGSSSLVDKTTSTLASFKSISGKRGMKSMTSPEIGSRLVQNGSPQNSDSDDKDKDDSEEEEAAVGTRTRKRGRGRPPKKTKESKSGKGAGDPYEFEEESNDGGGNYPLKRKADDGDSDNEEDDQDEEAKRKPKYTINGKEVLPVKCKGELANLHLCKFISGVRGHSIKYRDQWMTPQEFEMIVGGSGKKYLENIATDYGPLKALTASGRLKPYNSRSLRDKKDDKESFPDKKSKRKRRNEEEEEEREGGDSDNNQDDGVDNESKEDFETANITSNVDQSTRIKKKKKKHRDDWKRQLKTESAAIMAGAASTSHAASFSQQAMTLEDPLQQQPPIIMPERTDNNATVVISGPNNTFSLALDQPPKISPSAIIPEQQQQPQTLYVMSPHPSMATPPTPQHNPFASAMSPTPQPLQMLPISTSSVTHTGGMIIKQQTPSPAPSPVLTSTPSSSGLSRIGNILNVRCKSTTALLYANKYESGSKGKCIQLGDEWLTPNEFEDRAGSKAKKYLSSIKCMGRPLRVYVNSGELRGSGRPPQPKGPKKSKLFPSNVTAANVAAVANAMTPIAPAPIQAPPTPSHISSAPQIPHNLGMVMNAQPPILLNQQHIPTSIVGANMIPGMTFTLAQPLDVRQSTQGLQQNI